MDQGGICFCCIIYTYFRVPEPQGRTFAELDLLFERGVSARKFASTTIDVFDDADSVTKAYHVEDTSVVKELVQEKRRMGSVVGGVADSEEGRHVKI